MRRRRGGEGRRRIFEWRPSQEGDGYITPGSAIPMRVFRRGPRKPRAAEVVAALEGEVIRPAKPSARPGRMVPRGGPRHILRAMAVWHDVRPR